MGFLSFVKKAAENNFVRAAAHAVDGTTMGLPSVLARVSRGIGEAVIDTRARFGGSTSKPAALSLAVQAPARVAGQLGSGLSALVRSSGAPEPVKRNLGFIGGAAVASAAAVTAVVAAPKVIPAVLEAAKSERDQTVHVEVQDHTQTPAKPPARRKAAKKKKRKRSKHR